MKKRFLSLAMALAVCLGLAVHAAAYENLIEVCEDDMWSGVSDYSGDGWSYDSENNNPGVLKLSGAQNLELSFYGSYIIELAPGTKSSLYMPIVDDFNTDGSETILTFRGSGELEIFAYPGDTERGALNGCVSDMKMEDGLVMTGGAKQGDSYPAALGPKTNIRESGRFDRTIQANGAVAQYVHIGPAGGASAPASTTGFSDVAANSPFAEAIKWAVEQKITNGKTATTFGPGDTCTVSHILTFLYRAEKGAGSGNERAAVTAWANLLGIDTSNLSAPCTRAMAVNYMWKAAGSPAPAKQTAFADVPSGAEYAKAVSWAVEKGITNGTGGDAFSPGGTCTRGQIVTFLFRASK